MEVVSAPEKTSPAKLESFRIGRLETNTVELELSPTTNPQTTALTNDHHRNEMARIPASVRSSIG